MRVFRRFITGVLLFGVVGLSSCKKTITEEVVYDNVIYELNDQVVYSTAAEKNRQKTPTQFISILYADLFNQSISTNDLAEIAELSLSIGDKGVVTELLLSHYLNDPQVDIPTDSQMRADIPTFVESTYVRFFQRFPTAYEAQYLKDLIEDDLLMTPENIYAGFVLSNEYYFY